MIQFHLPMNRLPGGRVSMQNGSRMRVIFLDIDGVLNGSKTPNPRDLPYIVDRRLLRTFRKLVFRTRAKVVLISDWRHDPAGLFDDLPLFQPSSSTGLTQKIANGV